MSDTLTPVPFFTDNITLVPHTLSTELADVLDKPLTVEEFCRRTGTTRVSLFSTDAHELVIRTELPDGRQVFAQGPEQFPVFH